jgi:hypothetical protein
MHHEKTPEVIRGFEVKVFNFTQKAEQLLSVLTPEQLLS